MNVKKSDKFYLPMHSGEAAIFKIVGESNDDYLLDHNGSLIYIPKDAFQKHAIKVGIAVDKLVLKTITDEKMVYVRFTYKETWIDKIYNFYCKKIKKRPDWENYY